MSLWFLEMHICHVIMQSLSARSDPIVVALAQGKANLDARDAAGRTALVVAAKMGRDEAVKALLLCKVSGGWRACQLLDTIFLT